MNTSENNFNKEAANWTRPEAEAKASNEVNSADNPPKMEAQQPPDKMEQWLNELRGLDSISKIQRYLYDNAAKELFKNGKGQSLGEIAGIFSNAAGQRKLLSGLDEATTAKTMEALLSAIDSTRLRTLLQEQIEKDTVRQAVKKEQEAQATEARLAPYRLKEGMNAMSMIRDAKNIDELLAIFEANPEPENVLNNGQGSQTFSEVADLIKTGWHWQTAGIDKSNPVFAIGRTDAWNNIFSNTVRNKVIELWDNAHPNNPFNQFNPYNLPERASAEASNQNAEAEKPEKRGWKSMAKSLFGRKQA